MTSQEQFLKKKNKKNKQKAKIRPSHLSLALWAVFSRENNRNEEEVVVVVEEEEEGKQ